ncbi:MAG TPA: DUF2461 domain-containing protein [Gemmatimonadaceae bacterium]|nr:DUF2461 domain-containing protein [Gemmatimonadaceae bacterium]
MTFNPAALQFLRGLAAHNDKQWFEGHRSDYELQVRDPMRALVEDMLARFRSFAPEIGGDPARTMFRINRDVRFSKDKSPYKTHAACWFHHRGASRRVGSDGDEGSAGFYFHLEPGGRSMLGAGIWMPPRAQLNRIRDAIAEKPAVFDRVARAIPKRFGGLQEYSMLKRMPRGYAEEHPAAKWLRYQSFTSGRTLADADVTTKRLPALLAREYKALLPLVRWVNGALGLSS